VIRAKIRRDGPGEWSWTVLDDHGDLVTGIVGAWHEALADVHEEFTLLGESHTPARFEFPIIRGPITPGAATVPAGGVRCDLRPPWKRWLGLP
jgi:hypothetical protein